MNIDRRNFLRTSAALGVTGAQSPSLLFGLEAPGARARPSAEQRAWQDLEVGMFVHFAPNTWQDLESDDLSTPLSAINPVKLDTDQWARTAVALGARYIVFVAKHQGGFCMWQTHTTDYGIRNTPWKDGKGDVLAEVAASCRRFGLKLGVYVCPRDDFQGVGTGGIAKKPEMQAKYDALYREQLTEVLSRYGELVEVWFDGSTTTPVGDILAKYQPHAMVFQGPQATIRWVGTEAGSAPYPCWNGVDAAVAHSGTATALDSDPGADFWLPNEVDVSIRRPNWFWSTKNANKVLTLEQMLSVYYRSVGRGAQLLLNIPANRDGLLDAPDCKVAAELGAEVKRRFGTAVASGRGTGRTVELKLSGLKRLDCVILQEDISLGERVRAYRLEGFAGGAWTQLGEGTAIGHKRIQPVTPVTVSAVRLVVTEAVGTPQIRTLALFDTGVAPPADWNEVPKIWSDRLVGEWSGGSFSLDLTKFVKVAGQYRLRIKAKTGTVRELREVALELGGVSVPGLVMASTVRPDEVLLNITGLDRGIRVTGRVVGAESGVGLLDRR